MVSRRTFLITTASAAAAPLLMPEPAQAQDIFDPKPQYVSIRDEFLPGQMLVLPRSYYLYWVTEPRRAIRYGVSVGMAGLEFTGSATIDVKKEWPTWRPTDDMIERSPNLYGRFKDNDYVQPGGPENPLGARALYLFQNGIDTYFRVHGTSDTQSIGRSVSNGCIRMLNAHVVDLYERVPIGTVVTVI